MRLRTVLTAVAFVLAAVGAAEAMFLFFPDEVPVDRLVANLTKRIEKDPKSAHLEYLLGRVHAMAHAYGTGTALVAPDRDDAKEQRVEVPPSEKPGQVRSEWAERVLPEFHPESSVLVRRQAGDMTPARLDHLRQSILHYRRSTELDATRAIPSLGLGWMLESGSDLAGRVGWPDGVERPFAGTDERRAEIAKWIDALAAEKQDARDAAAAALLAARGEAMPLLVAARETKDARAQAAVAKLLAECWLDDALVAYRRVNDLCVATDRARDTDGPEADSLPSREATEGILRILAARPQTPAVEQEVQGLRKYVAELRGKGSCVTPVLFPADGTATLRDLAPPGRTAVLDLDGDGALERWEWVGPDAALLCWRPTPGAAIDSGRRLFGTRTWWVFWTDGYEPLAALDDDGDGHLRGRELDGICVWRDLDGDGVAADSEVTTAAAFGVASIAVRPDGVREGVLANDAGIRMRDGTTRPSFDWVSRRVPDPPPASSVPIVAAAPR